MEGFIFCVIATALVFLVCRGFIHSKLQTKDEVTENYLHREIHIVFATILIFIKHLFCHRVENDAHQPITMAEAITGGLIEAVIGIVAFFVIYHVLTWLLIKREDNEGRAVMAYYLVIVAMVLREIAPGLAILLAEI